MKEFLAKKLQKKPGKIIDLNGNILGEHEGAFSFTIGQRKGIKIGGGPLFSKKCEIIDFVGKIPDLSKKYSAKIRYRQEDQVCHISETENSGYIVEFDEPQRAIASGQICVIYQDDIVIGSGIIK